MKNIHLLLIYICTILFCTSCNENDEFIREQPGEKYSRSEAIANILGETENLSLYISPELENTPLTKNDVERIKNLALKVGSDTSSDIEQGIVLFFNRKVAGEHRIGYHEELIQIDDLYLIVALEWEAVFNLFADYNAQAHAVTFANIHMSLKDVPSGYWYKIALKGWNFDMPDLVYRGEGELCKYMFNEEHIELIGYTFSITPQYNGYGVNFRYTLERNL